MDKKQQMLRAFKLVVLALDEVNVNSGLPVDDGEDSAPADFKALVMQYNGRASVPEEIIDEVLETSPNELVRMLFGQ